MPGKHRPEPWRETSGSRSKVEADWSRVVFIDWDKPAPPDWAKARSRSAAKKALRGARRILIRESAGKGFHILVEFGRALSAQEKFDLREALGDDPVRLTFDRSRYGARAGRFLKGASGAQGRAAGRSAFRGDHVTGVIFDAKDGASAGPWQAIRR